MNEYAKTLELLQNVCYVTIIFNFRANLICAHNIFLATLMPKMALGV